MADDPTPLPASDPSLVSRRDALRLAATAVSGALAASSAAACARPDAPPSTTSPDARPAAGGAATVITPATTPSPAASPILRTMPLGFQWEVLDPFLFCVHHDDRYPAGNPDLGPAASLEGRDLGQDFAGKDGWRMYHGRVVPGFPRHPHRGFETVTVVRKGLLDHSDSLGAGARYGGGDVQWLTAGAGIMHAEMFPLLDATADNPLELFQIWLNLPKSDKFATPHFTMLWRERIPVFVSDDGKTRVTVTAGALGDAVPLAPPPQSYGSRPDSDLAIWTLKMEPGARFTLPAARPGTNRVLYYFAGEGLTVAGAPVAAAHGLVLTPDVPVPLAATGGAVELLLLQGRPIGEPVVARGPFVMNTAEEIAEAWADYRRTRFGSWPWPSDDPVHGRSGERFAKRPDGSVERPT